MPVIVKKCFLFHYNPSINSDKVFNLFLIDNQNGTYSAFQEHGRSGAKLRVLPLVVNCSLILAQSRYSAKLNEKIYHPKTPYTQTLNAATSPTFKQFGAEVTVAAKPAETAKIIDFKPAAQSVNSISSTAEKECGEQAAEIPAVEIRSKRIGVLNLNNLDALEF
ncbi:MAG: hypothetical protein LH472_17030 [Pyrinomonadaceae bacterium]|nr:hypothetical protein [Pyrinomonadaceae bacterium]